MLSFLAKLINGCHGGEYSDARYEVRNITEIGLSGQDVGGVRFHEVNGGVCRTIGREAGSRCVFSASCTGLAASPASAGRAKRQEKPGIGSVSLPPVRREVCRLAARAADIPLEEKLAALRQYGKVACASKAVAQATIQYREECTVKYLVNSLSSAIVLEQQSVFCLISLWLQNGQAVPAMLSGIFDGDRFMLLDEHVRVESLIRLAESVQCASALPMGQYCAVLDPGLAGAVIHETVGHIFEADNAYRSSHIREHFRPGRRICQVPLTVVDDASLPGLAGSYAYDDEGVPAQRTTLISDGCVANRLHNLHTAALCKTAPTGNGRAVTFADEPIVRCSNTMLLPGNQSTEELIESIPIGVYLQGIRGGKTYGDRFHYGVAGGFWIRNGRFAEPIGNVTIQGSVSEFVANITGIGNSVRTLPSPFCTKQCQPALPIWSGSPAIKVNHLRLV